ncbi:uncharacterized protein [Molothrus aeneus]|uniref:uncharacterized protein n=1 Tax=Molothrus aeneus TaxID=84833 RepID=UPI003458A11B
MSPAPVERLSSLNSSLALSHLRLGLSSSVGLNAVPSRSVQFTSAKVGWIRQIAARVGRSAPGGDRAPGQPPQPGSSCPCPPPRPPERALQRRTRPLGQERGQCPRLGSSAGRQRAVPSGQEKSSNSSHLCPQLWCWSSQRQEASAAGLCAGGLWSCPRCGEQTSQQSQIAVEARAVFGAGSAESCVCLCCPSLSTGTGNSLDKGIGAVADAHGEEHKPTAIQPDSPLHPELSTHPHREAQQLKEKNPQKKKQPAGKGEEDPCGMRLQRASRGAASGWRKAKGPTRWHQGTCEEQNGHLEATWRKGMHSFVFSTHPVAPTWESFPSLLHFQLDPWKTPNSIPLIFRCQRHEGLLPFRSSWPPPALRSQPAGTQPGNTKEHGWQPAGDTEAPGPEKQPWPQQPASFGAGSTHLQATPPGTLQKSFGHGAR